MDSREEYILGLLYIKLIREISLNKRIDNFYPVYLLTCLKIL
jgi:hypothetical protein